MNGQMDGWINGMTYSLLELLIAARNAPELLLDLYSFQNKVNQFVTKIQTISSKIRLLYASTIDSAQLYQSRLDLLQLELALVG